jgi:erythromycin esterase-like protein
MIRQLIERELITLDDAELMKLNVVYQDLASTKEPSSPIKEDKRRTKIYNALVAMDSIMNREGLHTKRTKELFVNAKSSYYSSRRATNGEPIRSRDETMADRITFLAEHSDDKIIVWAHNAHISNEVLIDNEIGLMGNKLKERFSSDYFSIGLSSLSGTYSYIDNNFINNDHFYTDDLKLGTLSYQPERSWESILGKTGDAPFFIISKDVNTGLDGKEIFGKGKLLGYSKETENDYYDLELFSMFDALIFVKNTNATTPLSN